MKAGCASQIPIETLRERFQLWAEVAIVVMNRFEDRPAIA
jgi:hypothetical protein